jgi:hypothetical protein
MKSFLINQGSMNDSLLQGPYATLAMVPATPWLKNVAPPMPALHMASRNGLLSVELSTTRNLSPWQWLIQLRTDTGWTSAVLQGSATSYAIPAGTEASDVTVRALNRVGVESPPISLSLSSRSSTPASKPPAIRSSPGSTTRGRTDGH